MAATANKAGWAYSPGASDQERDWLDVVADSVVSFENGLGPQFKENNDRRYKQYRGFKEFRDEWTRTGPNDRDMKLQDTKDAWGAQLHIPLSYATIEKLVPAAIAHRPKMLYLPRTEQWEENTDTVRLTIDSQQDQIDIDLAFQDVMRSGRIYGLGFGKSYWLRQYAMDRRVKRRRFGAAFGMRDEFILGRTAQRKVFDDPMFEAISVYDIGWDPMGWTTINGTGRCRYVYHRLWMDDEEIESRISAGQWDTEGAKALTPEDIRGTFSTQRWEESWNERLIASNLATTQFTADRRIHEVIEWHDGNRVLTALDRQVLVQAKQSQCVGMLPFQSYRPTPLQGQMVGIGDLEPLEHLQRELDTIRSQRRDAATLAILPPFIYDDGAIDEEDIVWGPGVAIRATNPGDVRAIFQQIQVKDVPGSGYQEEAAVRTDIDMVSGASDSLQPGGQDGSGTATEAQLVQASLGRRIQLSSRRFEIEVVKQAAKCFLYLDQRMILKDREAIMVPDEGVARDEAYQTGRYKWFPVGPGSLRGEFEVIPEGGSMAARNLQQDRQDAQMAMTMFGNNPFIDQKRPLIFALEKLGVKDPQAWLKEGETPVPQAALKMLEMAGVPPELIQQAVMNAQRTDPQLAQQASGPDAQAVTQMMQGADAGTMPEEQPV